MLYHSQGSCLKIVCLRGNEFKDKCKTQAPGKVSTYHERKHKMKITIFREKKLTYSVVDKESRILEFVGLEDRDYPAWG